jgi:hypothetical protein
MVTMSYPAGQDRDVERNVERERLVGFRQRLYGCFFRRVFHRMRIGDGWRSLAWEVGDHVPDQGGWIAGPPVRVAACRVQTRVAVACSGG